MLKRLLTILCASSLWLGAAVGDAQAAFVPLVEWNFNSGTANSSFSQTGLITPVVLTPNNLSSVTYATQAVAQGWQQPNPAGTLTTSMSYWSFTVAINQVLYPSGTFDLGVISFLQGADLPPPTPDKGPPKFQVYLGTTTAVGIANNTTDVASGLGAYSFDLSTLGGTTGLTSVTINIVAWDAGANGSNSKFYLDDISLTGNVKLTQGGGQGNVVPEPTSMALAGFAGIGMAIGAIRRRRQEKNAAA